MLLSKWALRKQFCRLVSQLSQSQKGGAGQITEAVKAKGMPQLSYLIMPLNLAHQNEKYSEAVEESEVLKAKSN